MGKVSAPIAAFISYSYTDRKLGVTESAASSPMTIFAHQRNGVARYEGLCERATYFCRF
jgi:hypothetical protein